MRLQVCRDVQGIEKYFPRSYNGVFEGVAAIGGDRYP